MALKPARLWAPTLITAPYSAIFTFTSTGSGIITITRCVVTNFNTGASETLTVYLCPANAAPSNTNTIIQSKVLAPGESYTCPEMAGAVLVPGDVINMAGTVTNQMNTFGSGYIGQ